jgi:hypothetical protein
MESFRNWRTGAIITGIAMVLSLLFLSIWPLVTSSGSGPIGGVPNDVRSLIANPPSVDCVALVTKYGMPTKNGKVVLTYIPNKVDTADATARENSDSVNISATPVERDRINASICSQPEEAGMAGVALVTKYPILGELNPNLFGQFVGTTPKAWADKVFSGKISYNTATTTMTQFAGLMTIFDVSYVKDLQTAWNYHATPEVLTTKANVRPIVENPNEYTGDFLRFRITWKGVQNCGIEFGYNVGIGGDTTKGDQRIAGFTCVTTPPPKTSTPPHGHSTPTPTPTPSPSCPPGKVKNINGKCVTGKDTSPTQYVYVPGKPAVVNDGGTDTAPVVHTATPTPSASPSASPSPEPVKQTDAPTPSDAPTTCPIPPGKTSC